MKVYKTQSVMRLLHKYPETLEQSRGQSASSLEDIGGRGGLSGKAKAQKKEELLCMIIDINMAIQRLPKEERRSLYETYVINQSTVTTPQLRSLVRTMNGPNRVQ